jgi:integrase
MSIRKKNLPVRNVKVYPLSKSMEKTWFVRFYVGLGMKHRLFINNKLSFAKRVIEAERIVRDLETNGFNDRPEKQENTANNHIKLLFDLVENKVKLSKKAKAAYLAHIRGLNTYCADNQIKSITSVVAEDFMQHLFKNHEARTVNSYRTNLKSFFKVLVRKRLVKNNPFDDTTALVTKQAFSEHYKDAELKLIIDEVKRSKPFLLLPILTIYYCFVRNGRELPHVKIEDIDFEAGKIWIDNAFAKNGKREAVLIPKQLVREFYTRDLHKAPPQYFAFGLQGKPNVKPVSQNYYQMHFRKILEKVGIYKKGKGIYRIKNTGNVALVKANFNRTAIQKQNRHSSFATTEAYISSLQVDDFNELKDNFPTL